MAEQSTNPAIEEFMVAEPSTNPVIAEFMASPLVTWFSSCLNDIITHKLTFEELVDGVLIYNVFLKMDIHGQIDDVSPPKDDPEIRLKNLKVIMANMRRFYEEDSIILKEPELYLIAHAADSNVREVELLLVLLLGCAVKCPKKKNFIEDITRLDNDKQKVIAAQIERVTHVPDVVLCSDMLLVEISDLDEESQRDQLKFHTQQVYTAFEAIRHIYKERVELIEALESRSSVSHSKLEVRELESKALQLRNMQDEYLLEIQQYKEKLKVSEKEKSLLANEAKASKRYRDELQAAEESALRADRLEQECTRYKNKLEQLDSCRKRCKELERDNQLLQENKDELDAQLNIYKAKVEKMMQIEEQMYKLKLQCDNFEQENNAFRAKIAKLSAVNEELERKMQLTRLTPGSPSSNLTAAVSNGSLNASFDNSIGEQMSRIANSQALQLELENRRLSTMVESLRESSFHSSSAKILDLEREKKRLELANEDLQSRLSQFEESTATRKKQQLRSSLEKESDSEDDDLNSSILKSPPKSQNQLKLDLDNVTHERDILKLQVRDTQAKLKRQTEIVAELESTIKSLQDADSPNTLKTEYEKLERDFVVLMSEYRKTKAVEIELTRRKIENRLEIKAKNARIIELDVYSSKLKDKCHMLSQLLEKMEADKRALMEYAAQMLKQNHELVTQALEDKEHYRQEEKKNNETVNHLNRAKEKLEEKIMDQFRKMENSYKKETKKKSAITVVKKTFGKVKRAGSELFSRRRKSWSDDGSSPTEKSDDFEFTRPSDVEAYVNVRRNRIRYDFMNDFEPEEFSFNTKIKNI